MPTYEFLCEDGHSTEVRTGYGEAQDAMPCPDCGLPAVRRTVYLIVPFTESGVSIGRLSDVPRDEKRINLSKFQEAAAEVDHAHRRAEEAAQRTLPTPDLFHEGVRRANEVRAGLRPPPKEF